MKLIMNANNIIGLNTSKNYWQFFIGLEYMTADFGLSGGNWVAFLFFIALAAGFAYFSWRFGTNLLRETEEKAAETRKKIA